MPFTYEFERPSCTVDIIIVNQKFEVLLTKRTGVLGAPGQGEWALPGGFIDPGEEPYEAAQRELAEETGLCEMKLKLFHVRNGQDPRGWIVKCIYYGRIYRDFQPIPNKEVMEFCWESLGLLGNSNHKPLFTDHNQILFDFYHTKVLD